MVNFSLLLAKIQSNHFSNNAYKADSQPKELMVVAIANHDDLNKIPFDKMESFFKSAFNN